MDMSTIAHKFTSGSYQSPLELASDAGRMFSSAAGHHPEGSVQHHGALRMQTVFNALWQRLLAPFVGY